MLVFLSFGITGLYGCSKSEVEEVKKEKIDIQDNLVIDINNGEEKYKYLNDGKFTNANIEGQGNLMAYNDKEDIAIFLERTDDSKVLNIILADDSMDVKIDGNLEFVQVSENGSYTLYKTCSSDNIVKYNLLNNKTKEITLLSEEVLISGNLIKFIDDDTLILYGVDIDAKKNGIFTYDISTKEYKLVNEIVGKFISSIEVISDNKILMIEVNEGGSDVYILDIVTKDIEHMTSKFEYVEDAILCGNKVFINALENGGLNLYSIDLESKGLRRLTFDFPKSLGRESRLLAENGKVYFSDINGKVYYYDVTEDTTNLMKNQNGMYMIVDK
ncbi:MAG: hypothetical protein ACRC6T_04080 [Sarcina sp.]